jgi:membrane-bound lytic murein transglycosylase D
VASQSLEKTPPQAEPPAPAAEPAPAPAPAGEPIAALEPAGAPARAAETPPPDDGTEEVFSSADLAGPEPKLVPVPNQPAPASVALAEPAVTPAAAVPPPSDDPSHLGLKKDRVVVDDDETLGHFADWLEVSPQRLRNLNHLKGRQPIHVGQTLRLDFAHVSPEEFQQRRLEYHKGIEEDFFGSYRVTGTVEHSLRSGDTLWVLSHKLYGVPTWLIHRYNPDVDFTRLVPGVKLQIPLVEKLG